LIDEDYLCVESADDKFYRFSRCRLCAGDLRRFFQLKGARRIRLFSVSRAQANTYKISVSPRRVLRVPGYIGLFYPDAEEWGIAQVEAGRPHIGIELLEEE
jgi:hypothetical protein